MDVSWSEMPEFPEFRALSLNDKPLFDRLFQKFPPPISEFTFTNLFIWRHAYRLSVTRFREFICLRGEKNDSPFFFPPVGEGDVIECFRTLLFSLKETGSPPKMVRVPETVIARFNGNAGGLLVEPDRDQFDYVYLVEDLATLKGRKYHRKRNHIKQFKEKYPFEYVPLDSQWISPCLQLQNAWCNLRGCESIPGLASEDIAVKEALTHFKNLNIRGGMILVGGKVEAFTLGEALNPETVVIHIEKANPAFEGIYPTLNQAFLEKEWAGYRYVNREQDLGEEGLRRAKESYFPDHMVYKYTITFDGA